MSEGEGHGNIGKESLSTEIKAMMSNMFTEFKTDIMQSVSDTMETRFNELYEEYDYSDVEESHNNLDVSALMQTITDSNKGESSTPQVTKTGNQPTEFDTILTELNPEKAHGPPICEKLAVLVNSLLKEGLSKDQLAMKKEYLKPENCPMLEGEHHALGSTQTRAKKFGFKPSKRPRTFNVIIICFTQSVQPADR